MAYTINTRDQYYTTTSSNHQTVQEWYVAHYNIPPPVCNVTRVYDYNTEEYASIPTQHWIGEDYSNEFCLTKPIGDIKEESIEDMNKRWLSEL